MRIQNVLTSPLVRKKLTSRGFSLVEVTMAIGLMSFCLVALVGVLPVGLSQERRSSDQMLALQALTAVAADFKNWNVNDQATSKYQMSPGTEVMLELDSNLNRLDEAGANGDKQYHITYTIEPPATGASFSNYRLSVRVIRTTQPRPTSDQSLNYVESVVLKPVS